MHLYIDPKFSLLFASELDVHDIVMTTLNGSAEILLLGSTTSIPLSNRSNETTTAGCVYWGTQNLDVKVWLILVFGSTISILSLTENCFLSYVFVSNARFRRSQLFYLCVLSFLDIFLAVSYLLLMSFMVLIDKTENLSMYGVWLGYVRPLLSLSVITLTTSVYLILAMTFERYLQTLTRLANLRNWVEKHRWLILITVFSFAAVIRGTKYWEIRISFSELCVGQFGEYSLSTSFLLDNPILHKVWTFWIRSLVHVIIPFPLLLYFNAAIIITMRKQYLSEKRATLFSKIPLSTLNSKTMKSSVKVSKGHYVGAGACLGGFWLRYHNALLFPRWV